MIARAGFTGRASFEALTSEEMDARRVPFSRLFGMWKGSAPVASIFVLTKPLVFVSAVHGEIVVHEGTETDFASIPWWAKGLLDDDDPRILRPATLHDDVYVRGYLSRFQADELLHEAMLTCGASSALAAAVFRAVRIGGASHYKLAASES